MQASKARQAAFRLIGGSKKALTLLRRLFLGRGNGAKPALHIRFGDGRVRFPEVSQVVFMGPGRYRLEGRLNGAISGKRGLRWQLRCASGARRVLAETDMLLGQAQQWQVFTLEADVPQPGQCRGQTLRLFHDARSASEELLSGEIWFSGLRLERISGAAAR